MQIAYQDAVKKLGAQQCISAAGDDCRELFMSLLQLREDQGNADRAARAIGRVEVACEQLRLIVGSGLVDLHKVSAYAQLVSQLRSHDTKKLNDEKESP